MKKITKHGKDRLRERKNSTGGSADAHLRNVLSMGVPHKELKGDLKEYVSSKFLKHGKAANNCRVYKGFLYIISGGTLITTYELQEEFLKHPEESFTAGGYIRYFYRSRDIKAIRNEDELALKMSGLINLYSRLCGCDFHCTNFEYNHGAYRLTYVSEEEEPKRKELEEMMDFFLGFTGMKIYLKRFRTEDTYLAFEEETTEK